MMLALLAASAAWAAPENPDWDVKPFLRPEAGLSSWSSGQGSQTAVFLGAQAGLNVRQKTRQKPFIQGQTRIRGAQTFGTGASGTDIRLGAFAGPSWGIFRLQAGPDVFWNRFTWGDIELAPTTGVAVPVMALAGLKVVALSAGVEPAFFLSSDRPGVDWSEVDGFGFGDEFTYFAAAGIDVVAARVNVSYSRTQTAFGAQQGIGVGLRLGL